MELHGFFDFAIAKEENAYVCRLSNSELSSAKSS